MRRFAELTGRRYGMFEYEGIRKPNGSSWSWDLAPRRCTRPWMRLTAAAKSVGVLKVRLFRPFSIGAFLQHLPRSVRAIAVLDRTKEPGRLGEPLYQDVITALVEAHADGTSPLPVVPVLSEAATVWGRKSSRRQWRKPCSTI